MKTHVITDDCEKIRPNISLQLFDRLYKGFKCCSYRKNTMSELKAVLEMTTAHPDTS